jgi:hypothetical protein
MKRLLTYFAGLAVSAGSVALAGEATAVSIATRGGSASANATAIGNSRSTAIAGATRGGRAIANSTARGRGLGFADSRSVAVADHGLAISNANADALGIFGGWAIADSESIAATIGGVAVSNSDAVADGVLLGHAISRSTSTALSYRGSAFSDSQAVSRGRLGGLATSVSDAFSNTYGGHAVSRVSAVSDAGFRARAQANGIGLSVSGPFRGARADVRAESHAYRSGRADSRSIVIRVKP